MDTKEILKFVKFNLGISTTIRDEYLTFIIESSLSRLKRAGADPEGQDEDYKHEYFMYVVDESAWIYRNRGGEIPLPIGLRERRNTLIVERKDV